MGQKMKAVYYEQFGDLNQLITGELDKPEPGEGEILLKMKSAGVNPVDAAVARGMLKDVIPTEFPVVPGWDVAGIVEERGHAARRFENGDEVYAYARRPVIQHGTFAEYISLPENYLAHRPQSVSIKEAGGIPLVGLTAYQSLFDAGSLKEGETLLILGASGGVGSVAIQLAKNVGATVIGVASEKNHEYMQDLGADKVIDYSSGDVGERLREIAPGGVDMIFHCSRGDSLNQSKTTLKPSGRLISITNSEPDVPEGVMFQYVFVEPNAQQLDHLRQLADEGNLTLPVTETYSLDEAGAALRDIESLHTRGKRVITP
ncbi:MAG: zinc-binding dehydrogenase [Bacteroidetes bacterium]|jgi:NADPH:quinone reductase-like Zn-dependent oxidoreductase|nr:zinc-binding dehydrogenase [Bacteroidota bacterium]